MLYLLHSSIFVCACRELSFIWNIDFQSCNFGSNYRLQMFCLLYTYISGWSECFTPANPLMNYEFGWGSQRSGWTPQSLLPSCKRDRISSKHPQLDQTFFLKPSIPPTLEYIFLGLAKYFPYLFAFELMVNDGLMAEWIVLSSRYISHCDNVELVFPKMKYWCGSIQ